MGAVITCSLAFALAAAGAIAAGAAVGMGAAMGAVAGNAIGIGANWAARPLVGMRLMRSASSPSLISISAMPDSSSSSISFLIFRISMKGDAPLNDYWANCFE